jgi:hypothetical protein
MQIPGHKVFLTAALAASASLVSSGMAAAEEPSPRSLSIELNRTEQQEGGACRLTFVARNGLGSTIDKLVIETVLFSASGDVLLLTLFDFEDLPLGSPRVRQFDLAGTACGALGQVLFNGVETCDGAELDPGACGVALQPSSRVETEVLG